MSGAMSWVLLQLAMSYYGDSLKEFEVDNDQIFMKLLTQFSIPNPRKADLAKTNESPSKTQKKAR